MLKIGIIIGSTRPNRIGAGVAQWVYAEAKKRTDAEFVLIDLKDFNLPLLDEPTPAAMASTYTKEHTRKWSAAIAPMDGFIFVTPEYNHGVSGALKNAVDFLYKEWNKKVAGFVSYGGAGGARAVEQLRTVLTECQVATIEQQLLFFLKTDFENFQKLRPASNHVKTLGTLIDNLLLWGEAMAMIRGQEQMAYDEKKPLDPPGYPASANVH